jgi:hypothetical protein
LIGVAATLALAEILLGIFADPQPLRRAEAFPYLAVRPWLLALLALLLSRFGWQWRLFGYALFLAVAGASESGLLLRLGNPWPWDEMVRGWAGAVTILVPLDIAMLLSRRRLGRWGAAGVAVAIALALALPALLTPYRNFVAGPSESGPARGARPELLLMTSLPIIWGEKGAFDPESHPATSYRILQEEFTLRPIDTLDSATLEGARLLLLAQPRWLAPSELVAVDRWVRKGGRALILTDPQLEWPSDLPLGDIRRPPPVGLLKPLLDHWGLKIGARPIGLGGWDQGNRRLVLPAAGRFIASGRDCRVMRFSLADCRIGGGRALLIADADLMRDDVWMAPGPNGDARHRRFADNPLVVADLLDQLAGISRDRVRASVLWAHPGSPSAVIALIPALFPLLALGVVAFAAAALLHRRRSL